MQRIGSSSMNITVMNWVTLAIYRQAYNCVAITQPADAFLVATQCQVWSKQLNFYTTDFTSIYVATSWLHSQIKGLPKYLGYLSVFRWPKLLVMIAVY